MNSPCSQDNRTGQAIVEFAIALPLQLMIMFAIMQLALIYVGKQVVTYASYSAARSAMVAESRDDAQQRADNAAAMICSPITGQTLPAGQSLPPGIEIPGWGELPRSDISRVKTSVSLSGGGHSDTISATVTHHFELQLPYVNYLFQWFEDLSSELPPEMADENIYNWVRNVPHVPLRSTTTLAIPWNND